MAFPIIPLAIGALAGVGVYGAARVTDSTADAVDEVADTAGQAGSVLVWAATGAGVLWLAKWLKVF